MIGWLWAGRSRWFFVDVDGFFFEEEQGMWLYSVFEFDVGKQAGCGCM